MRRLPKWLFLLVLLLLVAMGIAKANLPPNLPLDLDPFNIDPNLMPVWRWPVFYAFTAGAVSLLASAIGLKFIFDDDAKNGGWM